MDFRGARYLHLLVPCPLGWSSAPADTIRIARLAKESGLFPVFEAVDGEVTAASGIRRLVPVEEYLRLQGRFRHLFDSSGAVAKTDIVARLQKLADANIERFGLLQPEVT
jgi:pyruvate ferredoxin oxidoreductase beta subunit